MRWYLDRLVLLLVYTRVKCTLVFTRRCVGVKAKLTFVFPFSFMSLSLTSYLGKSTPLSQLPLDSCPRRSWLRMISLAEFDSLYTHPIRSIVASKLNKTYTFEIEIVCFHLASYFLSLIL